MEGFTNDFGDPGRLLSGGNSGWGGGVGLGPHGSNRSDPLSLGLDSPLLVVDGVLRAWDALVSGNTGSCTG